MTYYDILDYKRAQHINSTGIGQRRNTFNMFIHIKNLSEKLLLAIYIAIHFNAIHFGNKNTLCIILFHFHRSTFQIDVNRA